MKPLIPYLFLNGNCPICNADVKEGYHLNGMDAELLQKINNLFPEKTPDEIAKLSTSQSLNNSHLDSSAGMDGKSDHKRYAESIIDSIIADGLIQQTQALAIAPATVQIKQPAATSSAASSSAASLTASSAEIAPIQNPDPVGIYCLSY